MSVIDTIRDKYTGMDPVQRQNFWFALIGFALIVLLLFSLGDTYESIRKFLGGS